MIGAIVHSKAFGQGIIIEKTDGYIKVKFAASEKEFPFPRAFEGFLSTEDDDVLAEVEHLRQIAIQEKARREEEARLAEVARQEENARRMAKLSAGKVRIERKSSSPNGSNLAFKCNFCDGGASEDCVGFKGPCSDIQINYNIERAKHVWCSTDSGCKKYYDLKIKREKLDNGFLCYESRMLLDWKCCAGVIRNGYDAGRPMKLRSVRKNSLAVMTTRDPGKQDYTRYIFGVFLIDEYFEGDERDEGYVTCHSKWRIELNPTEAHQILFWRYYYNENAPEKMVFGSGLHRYLTDVEAAQILRDIVKVKRDESEKELAKEFLLHYCELHIINVNEIPEPGGALRLRNKA